MPVRRASNPAADPAKAHAMQQIRTLLLGALDARGRVLLKLNVPRERLEAVIGAMPSAKAPTVNELYGGAGYAVESVVPKRGINTLIPTLMELGATDVLELPILKIIP